MGLQPSILFSFISFRISVNIYCLGLRLVIPSSCMVRYCCVNAVNGPGSSPYVWHTLYMLISIPPSSRLTIIVCQQKCPHLSLPEDCPLLAALPVSNNILPPGWYGAVGSIHNSCLHCVNSYLISDFVFVPYSSMLMCKISALFLSASVGGGVFQPAMDNHLLT